MRDLFRVPTPVCTGLRFVTTAAFRSGSPWILPLRLVNFSANRYRELPEEVTTMGRSFELQAVSLWEPPEGPESVGHYSSLQRHHDGSWAYYNALHSENPWLRLCRADTVVNSKCTFQAQFAFYLLV